MPRDRVVAWYDAVNPTVSIVVLNYNKPELTLRCLRHLWCNTWGYRYEVIVVDNGSSPAEFAKLQRVGPARILRLTQNRYFGEGNNIGAEQAKGDYVVFLNNDAFVADGWLAPLVTTVAGAYRAGAAGPRLLYPDGRLQEAGAYVDETGEPIQVGKMGADSLIDVDQPRIVDYCSAACLLVRRDLFVEVGGFDLIFDPAYYEDVDLCLRIASQGRFVYYCPASVVVHLEHATTAEVREHLPIDDIVALNRANFLSRWGAWLDQRAHGDEVSAPGWASSTPAVSEVRSSGPRVVFYTPFDLLAGGGDRYLLSAAAALAHDHDVFLATEEIYSALRLRNLSRELGIGAVDVTPIRRADLMSLGEVACSVMLGNEALPCFAGFGRRNVYVCQFPFRIPMEMEVARRRNIETIDETVVYSRFAERHLVSELARLGIEPLPIRIVAPPVTMVTSDGAAGRPAPPYRIVCLGRFFEGGHNKRHDVAIEAVRRLSDQGLAAELDLVGTLHSSREHRAYYARLKAQAAGLPVRFHPNAPRDRVERLLDEAHVYWHAAGFEIDTARTPEKCEHFGISIVEAMSAGCVPLVYAEGGPLEIVSEGQTGYLYRTIDELVGKTRSLLEESDRWARLAEQAKAGATRFSDAVFRDEWRRLAADIMAGARS
ncbi:MAG: glycosyltransferase [Xanthobacteraceae bacterium]|nr:glycosyltransferase [Xanthobacteraceae bacterium]